VGDPEETKNKKEVKGFVVIKISIPSSLLEHSQVEDHGV
jgi:hypothetical protein